ncbi:hypothetical protein [Nocardia sp. NPDC052566]|uniref:hypothetical protein n=1 Tax=Nocardia sp. NPDC052566 TaxID=3364330 RepID=UPI0037C9B416
MNANQNYTAGTFVERVHARRVQGMVARIARVEVDTNPNGGISVKAVWADVDRPVSEALGVGSATMAARLKRAMEAGVVYPQAFVTRDFDDRTYVAVGVRAVGHGGAGMGKDLRRLGF